jgi:hypothetical protein
MFTSDPAYSTSTGPDPVAAVDGLAADVELEDELLDEHAAADSPRNAMPSTAAVRLRDERKSSIPRQ